MTDDETDDELWLGMTRHEYRALNNDDQARARAALKRHAQKFSTEETARATPARQRRTERRSRSPYTDPHT